MCKLFIRVFFIAFFFTVSVTYASAQQEDSVVVAPPDSVEMMLDSISDQIAVSDSIYHPDESYTDDKGETLYFIGKEDSLSLYDSSLIEWRMVPDTTIQALKNDKNFWYANKDRKQKNETQDEKVNKNGLGDFLAELLGSKAVRQAIFIFILVLFAVAVIWFLAKNKMNLFGRGKGSIVTEQTLEGEPESIFTADLQSAIENAEKNEEYRLAIRLSYLLLLKRFSDEGWIKYKEDATNMEYLSQLYNHPFYKEFFIVTRNYEYAWYGEMPVNKFEYDHIRQDFTILYTKAALSN